MTDYDNFGEDQQGASQGSTLGLALTFLFVGLGAGALVALLLAPKEGKKTRRVLRRKYEDAMEAINDWKETAEEMFERGGDWAESAKETAKETVEPLRRMVRK